VELKNCKNESDVNYLAHHGGDACEVSKQTGLTLNQILDFSLNVNPYGPPKAVFRSIRASLGDIKNYPPRSYDELRASIAAFLCAFEGYNLADKEHQAKPGITQDNIVLGCGATELIHSFLARFVRGGSVAIPLPTFSEYEAAASALGIGCIKVNPRGINVDLDSVSEHLKAGRVNCVMICNPNNPTGELIDQSKLVELLNLSAEKGGYLMVDEAYLDLSSVGLKGSLLPLAEKYENLIVLKSLTKLFGFPGLRVGYAVCGRKLARIFEATAISWRVGALETEAVKAALKVEGFLEDSRGKIQSEKPVLAKGLGKFEGLRVEESSANFMLVEISGTKFSPSNLKWRLLSHGVLVRELSGVQGLNGNYIRVCVRSSNENEVLLRALKNILSSASKINSPVPMAECSFRPCHFEGQDCRICFCPFYPCLDNLTGGKYVRGRLGGKVWSCADCTWIHRKEPVDKIISEFNSRRLDPISSDSCEILGLRRRVLEEIP
jgi:histidinol-phosphate aminotransferase